MAKTGKNKKEEPIKFEGSFVDFIKAALNHEPIKFKKNDKVAKKDNPKEIFWVFSVMELTGKVEVIKENSDEKLEFDQKELMLVE